MLTFADELRVRGTGLRVLNLGGGDVDTATPMGAMLFTIMVALAQMEHEIKRERVRNSISKRRNAGANPGGRPQRITDSQIRSALRLVEGGDPAAQVARDLGMSRATFYRRSRTRCLDQVLPSTFVEIEPWATRSGTSHWRARPSSDPASVPLVNRFAEADHEHMHRRCHNLVLLVGGTVYLATIEGPTRTRCAR